MAEPIIGAIARPQLPPEQIREVALAAEEAGLAELWLWEDCFWEGGISMSAALLAMTERLTVGIGLLPMPLRNVALAAMEIAAVERLFPGRFVVGLGHGVQDWMSQAGARVTSPMTLAREHVAALRRLLAGDEVTTAGEYVNLDAVRLVWPPAAPPLLHLGAFGPNAVRLTGEIGDGLIVAGGTSVDAFGEMRAAALEARAAAGRHGEHIFTVFVAAELSAAGAAEQLAEWAAVDVDRVVFCPGDDEPDPVGFVQAVAALSAG